MRRGIKCADLFLFVSLASCSRPGDTTLNKMETNPLPVTTEKPGPALHTIEISDMKFQPENMIVHVGDTVMWTNKDMMAHCVTETLTKAWTSSKISKDSSWKIVVIGSADYYCAIHQVMKGKITVE